MSGGHTDPIEHRGSSYLAMVLSCLRFSLRDLRNSGRYLWLFWLCLVLGVTLVAASGGLLRQVSAGLLADTRALFGGDLEIETRVPLDDAVLKWMHERGEVSLLIELRTMMFFDEQTQLVELQSVDERYPLYGDVELEPQQPVHDAVAFTNGAWGVALDPVAAQRLAIKIGDRVAIGEHLVEVRALIRRQPDRSLTADWRGPPVLIAAQAVATSGLVTRGSRLEYAYRVKVQNDPSVWGEALAREFPDAEFEVQSFNNRRGRIAKVLDQVASGLLLTALSALFIGGLGVFNSIRAYLDTKLATIATLRSLGLRNARLIGIYLTQVMVLAASAAFVGAVLGGVLAYLGASVAGRWLPVAPDRSELALPLVAAWVYGVLTAFCFALPAVGRALSVQPATLFREADPSVMDTPNRWWWSTVGFGVMTAVLILITLPQPLFGIAFIAGCLLLLVVLEGLVRATRWIVHQVARRAILSGSFALKLAVSSMCRPGAPLRVMLITLGSALTLLVACTIVLMALLKTIQQTIPNQVPALAFYDISPVQVETLRSMVGEVESLQRLELVPLVLGRISHVNATGLRTSDETTRVLESRDEHKLTHGLGNIDSVTVVEGRWWPANYDGPPLVAFEDREANQLGLQVGDRLRFTVMGATLDAELAAIYSQRGIGTRFWFEGIFSAGALTPFITRYVGTAYLDHAQAIEIEARIAAAMPNVVSIRTQRMLNEARAMLGRAATGISVVGGFTLIASLLVLASVIAASRRRQVYEATILHTLGARFNQIRRSVLFEYTLIALLTSAFAIAAGSAIAAMVLRLSVDLDVSGVWLFGAAVALFVSVISLNAGALAFLRALRFNPSTLLRHGG